MSLCHHRRKGPSRGGRYESTSALRRRGNADEIDGHAGGAPDFTAAVDGDVSFQASAFREDWRGRVRVCEHAGASSDGNVPRESGAGCARRLRHRDGAASAAAACSNKAGDQIDAAICLNCARRRAKRRNRNEQVQPAIAVAAC